VQTANMAEVVHGRVVGVIIPPPDVRAVVDKTAQFVAKNGKNFEARILNSEEGKTAKFNFMRPFDPYHAYYEMKIRQFEEGKETAASSSTSSSSSSSATAVPAAPTSEPEKSVESKTVASKRASTLNPLARILLNKDSPRAQQELVPHEFSIPVPHGAAPLDIEVIKLSAVYTAVNGKDFLAGLAQREQRNPQFDFLKPTHIQFSYFTRLVDAYTTILERHQSCSATKPSAFQVSLTQGADKQQVMEEVVWRWKILNDERESRAQQNMADAERVAFLTVDWHDFVVVETIDWADWDLPAHANLPKAAPAAPAAAPAAATGGPPSSGPISAPGLGAGAAPSVAQSRAVTAAAAAAAAAADMDTDMDEDDGIRVVPASAYQPRLNPQAAGPAAPQSLVDPLSGKVVPADQISEHMRVQLLDPRWREEQRRFQDKQKETGLVAGDLISQNLRAFAQNRTDIIDNSNLNSAPAGPSAPIGALGPVAAVPPPPPPPPPRPPTAADKSEEEHRSKRTRN